MGWLAAGIAFAVVVSAVLIIHEFRLDTLETQKMDDQKKLDAIADTLGKAKTEILGEIALLKAGQNTGTPLNWTRLEGLAGDLDAIVPDAPAQTEIPA